MSDTTPPANGSGDGGRRAQWILALGAAIGLLAASMGLLRMPAGGDGALPDTAVARVGDQLIRRADYERLLAGLANDSRNPIDAADRRHILDRMIDEELLVQRALSLGLVQVDRRVRSDLTSNLIQSVVTGAEKTEPTREDLVSFYEENADFFTRPGRLKVRQIFVGIGAKRSEQEAAERAVAAHTALAARKDFEKVRETFGDDEISPVPRALLPPLKLREYVGPTVTKRALELEVGEVSEPIRSGTGIHIVELVDQEPAVTPALDQIEQQVRVEWRRRTGDRALRDYLDQLRDDAHVVTTNLL